jgi:hypothetical protein
MNSAPKPLQTIAMNRTSWMLVAIVFFTAAVRLPWLGAPLERDEGEYAYIGWRLGFHELPYRDWVDQKPPAIFWAYRSALSLPLESVRAIHVLALMFSAGSACAVFFLAHRFLTGFGAFAAAALFTLLSADPLAQGTAANTEVFMELPLLLSMLAFFAATKEERHRTGLAFLCGVLVGVATTFKQVAAPQWVLLVLLFPVFVGGQGRWRGMLAFALSSAAGVAAVWGVVVIYFYTQHGLRALIDNVFIHNFAYVQAVSWNARMRYCLKTLKSLSDSQGVSWLLSVIGLLMVARKRRWEWFLFLAGWFVASALGVGASGYFFPHYFQQLIPVVAICAACGAEAATEFLKTVRKGVRYGILCVVLFLPPVLTVSSFLLVGNSEDVIRIIYPEQFFSEMPLVGKRIAEVTQPTDRVFIFGAEPEVLFYARRASASRYIFVYPLFGPYANAHEKQVEAAKEISQAAPATAVYMQTGGYIILPGSDLFFGQWSRTYIDSHFRLDSVLAANSTGIAQIIPAAARPGDSNTLREIALITVAKSTNPPPAPRDFP